MLRIVMFASRVGKRFLPRLVGISAITRTRRPLHAPDVHSRLPLPGHHAYACASVAMTPCSVSAGPTAKRTKD